MPSSRSTRALARRVTREATDPSRANAISLLRSSSLRKWARIMPPSESAKPENSRIFYRDFNESGIHKRCAGLDVHKVEVRGIAFGKPLTGKPRIAVGR